MSTRGKEQWGSQIGVILAVAGSAVGLGNFLRFPGKAAANGGGAFMIPYFVSLLVLGIPLAWAEWNMGRWAGRKGFHSCPAVFNLIWRNGISKYFGVIGLVIPLVVYMYYVIIESWCLAYAMSYATGSLPLMGSGGEVMTDPASYANYFERVVGATKDGALLSNQQSLMLSMMAVTFIANFVLIYRGVTKGIEQFCKIALPIMVICALCVLVRVLTLGTPDPSKPDQNLLTGLGFMWNPDLTKLGDFKTWLEAAGQIFFSISVGFGIIINYSSYMRRNDDVVLSGLTAVGANEFFEVVLGGLITIPAGVMFLGLAIAGQGTFGLGFNTLPVVFSMMPGGQFFGFLWFFMLFLAAITSSLSMLQPVIAFLEEGFGMGRRSSVAFLSLLALCGAAFVAWFSKGLVALDTFDFWIGTAMIFVLAMFQTVLYSWCFGWRQGQDMVVEHRAGSAKFSPLEAADNWRMAQAHQGSHMRIPPFVSVMLRYVSPAFLLIVFIGFIRQEAKPYYESLNSSPVAQYSIFFIAGVVLLLGIMVFLAGHRWEKTIAERGGPDVEEASK